MTAQIQISGKSSSGVIFVVGGENVDDFRVNLAAIVGGFDKADSIIHESAKLITPLAASHQQDTRNGQTGAGYQQDDSGYQPQQQTNRQSTGQRAPTCAHGEREFKSGTSKAGKAYKLWSCASTDRSDQCEPQWVK